MAQGLGGTVRTPYPWVRGREVPLGQASITPASEISSSPSAFPPSAEATAGERRFARVTLGPRQMERTCCERFTRAGPDSCNTPPGSTAGSLARPAHRKYQGCRSWLTTARDALEARSQWLSLQLDKERVNKLLKSFIRGLNKQMLPGTGLSPSCGLSFWSETFFHSAPQEGEPAAPLFATQISRAFCSPCAFEPAPAFSALQASNLACCGPN